MCGITGYISMPSYNESLQDKIQKLKHRGPDGHGIYELRTGAENISLGHTRLSIIDVSESAGQPFISACKNYIIVFNGEIYNYKELRKDLNEFNFITESDTEVLLYAYIKFGENCVEKLNGMFSFVVYDLKKNLLLGFRDHLGIKPLYYYHDNEKLIFCSEIHPLFAYSGIKKEIDTSVLKEFLLNGYLYPPDTGFVSIRKLAPGQMIKAQRKGGSISVSVRTYWRPDKVEEPSNINNYDLKLKQSVEDHLVSDVPVGLFFSGGVDSTVILSYLQNNIKPFLIRFDADASREAGFVDDYLYGRKIADIYKTEVKEINAADYINFETQENFLNCIDTLSIETEELISDYAFLPSKVIARIARDSGYKVMLSGLGGDEIFGGYPRYRLVKYAHFFEKFKSVIPPFMYKVKSTAKKINRYKTFCDEKDFVYKYSSLIGYFSRSETENLLGCGDSDGLYRNKIEAIYKDFSGKSDLKKAMLLDYYGFLSHNFMLADKSSMRESVEMRVPLATKELFTSVLNTQDDKIVDFFINKKILKSVLKKTLPAKLIYRTKTGFTPPLDKLVNGMGRDSLMDTLSDNGLFNYIDRSCTESIVSEHFHKECNNTYKLFQLLYLSFWLKNNKV
jgi:asparagine synthase (glutamine-hydrolysing)